MAGPGGRGRRRRWAWGLGAALGCFACTDPVEVSDYDAGAAIRGTARSAVGAPVAGAAVRVFAYPSGCAASPAATTGGDIVTGADGSFDGEFSFLAAGPVVVPCVGIRLVDTATAVVLGDTVVAASLRFDAARSDTLVVVLDL